MKKALFISSRLLYPLIGGEKIRTAQTLRHLSQLYKVDVICESEEKNYTLGPLEKCINKYYHFYIPKFKHYLWTLNFLLNKDPLQVNYYYSKDIQKLIDSIIDEYDIIFCNNIRTTKYVINHPKVVRYVDFVDSIAMNYQRAKKESKGLKKIIYTIDAKRCTDYERFIYKTFDRCSVISDIDRNYILNGDNPNNINVIFNSVTIPIPKIVEENPYTLSFIGKMSYEPNIVAVKNFVKNIFPLILEDFPETKFYIVGANPTKEVLSLQSSNIIVTGFVDEVETYMQQSSIVIAPMLTGAGIQNKILQAMSLKCCVVTTTIGAEGLSIKNNEISIANGNINIANAIKKLIENKEERISMGKKAFDYIVNNFSDEKVFEDFKEFIDKGNKDYSSI